MSVCAHRPEPAGSFTDCSRVGGCACRDEVADEAAMVPQEQFQPLSGDSGGEVGTNATDVIQGRQTGDSA